jgi:hypothetical protein
MGFSMWSSNKPCHQERPTSIIDETIIQLKALSSGFYLKDVPTHVLTLKEFDIQLEVSELDAKIVATINDMTNKETKFLALHVRLSSSTGLRSSLFIQASAIAGKLKIPLYR